MTLEERRGSAVALALGKMPAETAKAEMVVMFKVGKGRLEKEMLVVVWNKLPGSGYPELGRIVEKVELRGTGNLETVALSCVVPPVTVVLPSGS